MRRKQLMDRLISAFQEPIQPQGLAVYLDELAEFTDDELDFAITYWVREKKKFPVISELRKACSDHRRANKAWNAIDTAKMLEEKSVEPIQWKRRDSSQDHTPEAIARRVRFLNSRYPSVLKRYSDEENRI